MIPGRWSNELQCYWRCSEKIAAANGGRWTPVQVQEHVMRKVIRGYAKDKNLNLILIGTIPVPHSKDKRSPAARQDKRYLVRQGATIFKKETIR
jgi:hypothetical protein